MNKEELNINNTKFEIDRMYKTSGNFTNESGRNISWSRYHIVGKVNGQRVKLYVDKNFNDVIEEEIENDN